MLCGVPLYTDTANQCTFVKSYAEFYQKLNYLHNILMIKKIVCYLWETTNNYIFVPIVSDKLETIVSSL